MPEEAGVNFPFWRYLPGMVQRWVKIFFFPCGVPLYLQTVWSIMCSASVVKMCRYFTAAWAEARLVFLICA